MLNLLLVILSQILVVVLNCAFDEDFTFRIPVEFPAFFRLYFDGPADELVQLPRNRFIISVHGLSWLFVNLLQLLHLLLKLPQDAATNCEGLNIANQVLLLD